MTVDKMTADELTVDILTCSLKNTIAASILKLVTVTNNIVMILVILDNSALFSVIHVHPGLTFAGVQPIVSSLACKH